MAGNGDEQELLVELGPSARRRQASLVLIGGSVIALGGLGAAVIAVSNFGRGGPPSVEGLAISSVATIVALSVLIALLLLRSRVNAPPHPSRISFGKEGMRVETAAGKVVRFGWDRGLWTLSMSLWMRAPDSGAPSAELSLRVPYPYIDLEESEVGGPVPRESYARILERARVAGC
ncbi:MAG: hypothetical protein KGJ69_15830, partial [Thermoplasmata archaeon]|nr:hypothetical protein [Thermoplasmata archaeon]